MNPSTTSRPGRTRLVAAGVVAASLTVAAGGVAMAAPDSAVASALGGVLPTDAAAPAPAEAGPDAPAPAHAVETDWSQMPEGYTKEQYEALWGAGYTTDDLMALAELWGTEGTETKARVGQMLLDGEPVPVAPGSTAPGPQYDAFWAAGYTADDLEALQDLWDLDWAETKLRAGQALLDGQTLPVAPGSTVAGS